MTSDKDENKGQLYVYAFQNDNPSGTAEDTVFKVKLDNYVDKADEGKVSVQVVPSEITKRPYETMVVGECEFPPDPPEPPEPPEPPKPEDDNKKRGFNLFSK